MLYYLFRFLDQFGISGAGLWSYTSFRAILALIMALVISMWFGELFIRYMKRKNISEVQRDASIDPYGVQKKGVPTMGGIIILVAIVVPCLLLGRLLNIYMILMLVTTIWLGILGFADDYIKMHVTKDGLSPKLKLLGQFILGIGIGLTLWLSPDAVVRENISERIVTEHVSETAQKMFTSVDVTTDEGIRMKRVYTGDDVKSTVTTIPFVKNNNFHYSDIFTWLGKYRTAAGWILFVIMTTVVVMSVSNGSNLNDGMDGMCAGNSAFIGVALGILAYVSSHIEYAAYLNIMYIPGSEELVIFCCAFVGALTGFLWYNAYPAQVFMGDTGSLAIGGIIAVLAVIIHKELLLPLLCFIFFLESVSVMLQLNVARWGNKRGKKLRVFKRAPFHDTFRVLPGQLAPDVKVFLNWPRGAWLESKITTRFWLITIIMAAVAILTLKIR